MNAKILYFFYNLLTVLKRFFLFFRPVILFGKSSLS